MVLQRFAVDPLIVSDLVYLDDALKGEDDRPMKAGTLEMVRRAVWRIVSRRCGGGVDIPSWAHQDDGRYICRMLGNWTDSVREKDRGYAPVVPSPHSIELAAN